MHKYNSFFGNQGKLGGLGGERGWRIIGRWINRRWIREFSLYNVIYIANDSTCTTGLR